MAGSVLVVVVIVNGVAVPVVQIVQVAVVLHRFVSAPGAMLVGVFMVCGLVLRPGIIVFGRDRHCVFLVPSSLLLTRRARSFVDCTAPQGRNSTPRNVPAERVATGEAGPDLDTYPVLPRGSRLNKRAPSQDGNGHI